MLGRIPSESLRTPFQTVSKVNSANFALTEFSEVRKPDRLDGTKCRQPMGEYYRSRVGRIPGGVHGAEVRPRRGAARQGRRRAEGHALGAVLRPRLRLRHNPALPPAPEPPDHRGGASDTLPAARGVVGVAVHDLVHQLVRSRRAVGTPNAWGLDAR